MAIRRIKILVWMLLKLVSDTFWSMVSLFHIEGQVPQILDKSGDKAATNVDSFWADYTVIGPRLSLVKTAYQSKKYLDWRFSVYPLFKEFMELWGDHDGQVILDYGCGPGNDLVGFLVGTGARKVIGIDISEKALRFTGKRLALHKVDISRVELIRISDDATQIPLEDNTIDYIYCEGVLHHTSSPESIIREFNRVLKPGGRACIMVYNNDSIWFHVYVAYEQMILRKQFKGLDAYQAFEKTTDSADCPIARCYKPQAFIGLCEQAGFKAGYVGGYFSLLELQLLKKHRRAALKDVRLGEEHKEFLKNIIIDERGYPRYNNKTVGIGGVYKLFKPR